MVKILLIEDDLDDVELLSEALKDSGIACQLDVINDGDEAIQHIRNCSNYPDLVILDFNLPKVHGRDILLEIKSLNYFKNIPLLILTTSSAQEDIDYAHKNGANKYLIKPTNTEQIQNICQAILELTAKTA